MSDDNGWNEWGKHVIKELERHDSKLIMIDKKLNQMQLDSTIQQTELKQLIEQQKVNARIWGAVAGAFTSVAAMIIVYINKII